MPPPRVAPRTAPYPALLCIYLLLGNVAFGFSSISPTGNPSTPHNVGIAMARETALSNGHRGVGCVRQVPSVNLSVRGGVDSDSKDMSIRHPMAVLASFWGVGGVVMVLLNAIRRVLPIALSPFVGGEPLTVFELAAYIITCIWFGYVEGYKGFQLKFSPLVVSRSFTLGFFKSPIHHVLFGPFYSMGLFHATKKRMIVSWSVTIGVAAVVAAVKRLPYPWRNIIDAGVVVGLTWGTLTIIWGYLMALFAGEAPEGVDPALPDKNE